MNDHRSADTDDQVRQLLVHPVLWPQLVAWLNDRGLVVGELPVEELTNPATVACPRCGNHVDQPSDDHLPTYITSPRSMPGDAP